MSWAAVAAAGASSIAGAASAGKAVDDYRALRSRQQRTLKYGRDIYGRSAASALVRLREAADLQGAATQNALRESQSAELAGLGDIQAGLDQQLASSRTGASGVLAQSSILNQSQRGIRADSLRALLAHRGQAAQQRAGIHMAGAAQQGSALQSLSQGLLSSASFKYGIQQDLAETFQRGGFRPSGGGGQPGGIDFGGLGNALGNINWGSMFGTNGGGGTTHKIDSIS